MAKKMVRPQSSGDTAIKSDETVRDVLGTRLPELLWPCFAMEGNIFKEEDQRIFGGVERVMTNYDIFKKNESRNMFSLGSSEFWKCFAESKDILLADMYFNASQYERMFKELKKLSKAIDVKEKNIRIYCGDKTLDELVEKDTKKKNEHERIYRKFVVTVKCFSAYYRVHDRFAIMDQEIWHFGAAVGGMHGSLSAYSRGWKDEGNALRDYFDEG